MPPLDIDRLRAETPGAAHVNHLDNAGAGLMPAAVRDAIVAHLDLEMHCGGYEAAAATSEDLDGVYSSIARLLNAAPDEIAILENATVAWQAAFYALDLKPGDRVLTGEAEYAANYVAFLHRAERDGIVIDVAPGDATGATDPDALEGLVRDRTRLIALTWIPTNGGLVNPAAEIGGIARRCGVAYLLDGCQAVGQMAVDVAALGCDFFAGTGRKFLRGPRGTGFLYVARPWIERLHPAVIDHFAAPWSARGAYSLRGDARRFETWENAYALRAGLGEAADYFLRLGANHVQKRAWWLGATLREELAQISGITVRDLGVERCAIVTLTHDTVPAGDMKAALAGKGINVSVSEMASTRLDTEARDLPPLLRISPHYYNSEVEIAAAIRAVSEAVRA